MASGTLKLMVMLMLMLFRVEHCSSSSSHINQQLQPHHQQQ
jgi:hypothetical protein